MLKIAAIAAIVTLPFLLSGNEANAGPRQSQISGSTGQCPMNTCGPRGLDRAKDVSTCSAKNCRKSGQK
jgi:hypothetical protein